MYIITVQERTHRIDASVQTNRVEEIKNSEMTVIFQFPAPFSCYISTDEEPKLYSFLYTISQFRNFVPLKGYSFWKPF